MSHLEAARLGPARLPTRRAALRWLAPILGLVAVALAVRPHLPGPRAAAFAAPSFMSYGVGVVPFGAEMTARPSGGPAVHAVAPGVRVALGGRVRVPAGLLAREAYWVASAEGPEPVYGFLPADVVQVIAGDPPRLQLGGVSVEAMLSPANAIQAGAALGAPVAPAGTVGPAGAGMSEAIAIAWLPDPVRRWERLFLAAGAAHGVDPALLAIIALVESGGNAAVYSPAGATGLMQVMPGTGGDIARLRGIAGFSPDALLVPETNVDFGAWYLAQQLKAFGKADDPDWVESVTLAAAAYNGGPGRVASYLRGGSLPAESERYRGYVGGMWQERADASSPTFERWMAAGGAHLVARAADTPGPEPAPGDA